MVVKRDVTYIAKPDQKYEFLVSDFRCNLMGLVGLVHKGPGIYEDDWK